MQIAVRRGILLGVLFAALAISFAALNRVPGAVSPDLSANRDLGKTQFRPLESTSQATTAPFEKAEDSQGSAEPDCQQSRDLLRAGADSQG